MQESRTNRQIPQSELRRKLELRLKERGFKRPLNYDISRYQDEKEEETPVKAIFGLGLCWIICLSLGIFIYANSLLDNNFSQGITQRTEVYLDGSHDIDTYWENFRNWVNDLRRSGLQRMD